ncbi:MAG: SDR family oxidoreductase [Sphingomonas fennica]
MPRPLPADVRRIVITGASSGIGAATAIAFAERGARLVLAARGREGLEDIAARCRIAGGEAHVAVVDTTDAAAVADLAEKARVTLGGIDLWFSNVGVGVLGRFTDVPIADHARVIDVNLTSHMNDAHAVLPIFLAQDRGIWVNMISLAGFVATPYSAAYSASKFGLKGFSQSLRGELSKRPGIHICDIYPTFIDTPGVAHAGNYTGARLKPPPGAMPPEAVAKAVVRLAFHPRHSTTIGMPTAALKLAQMFVPNLAPAVMNGFLDKWTADTERGPNGSGSIHEHKGDGGALTSGFPRPDPRPAITGAAAVGAGIAAIGFVAWFARRKR